MSIKRIVILAASLGLFVGSDIWSQESVSSVRSDFVQTFGSPPFQYGLYSLKSETPGRSQARLYLAFVNDLLQFVKDDEQVFRAKYEISIEVLDHEGVRRHGRIATHLILTHEYEETNSRAILNRHQFQFDLPPDDYDFFLEIIDLNTKRRLKRKKRLTLRPFELDSLAMSDVLFKGSEQYSGAGEKARVPILSKTLETQAEFGASLEVYGPSGQRANMSIRILDANDRSVFHEEKTITLSRDRRVIWIPIKERLERAGPYRLQVHLSSGDQHLSVEESFLSRYSKPASSGAQEATTFLPRALQLITTSADFSKLEQAKEAERVRWLDEFWRRRDPTPMTPENELKEEFLRRVQFAMQFFSVPTKNRLGWETDRGKIYITYGGPTELRRRSIEIDTNPYETWYYEHLDRRFVFLDKSGVGDYKLVHKD